MRKVSPRDFARALRRNERRRAFPYFGVTALLVVGGVVAIWYSGWQAVGWVAIGFGCVAVAYLAQYLDNIVRGRTVDPIAGGITLARPMITIVAGERTTGFSIADVAKARHIWSSPFDDLKGLADVLEIELISGPTLRIPETFTGFGDLLRELPNVQHVELE